MSVLRTLESKIAGLVEGTFNRAFRSEVRPVEIARKLAREMEEHRSQTLSRTYVPNEYRVFLSPRDRERFAGYESALADELAHAQFHLIRSRFGHDAFLKEDAQIAAVLSQFLASLEPAR